MDPVRNAAEYEKLILAGQPSPGIVKSMGKPMRLTKWDKTKKQGADGIALRLIGTPGTDFAVELYLWLEEFGGVDDFADWERWKPLLDECELTGKALDIYHPQLQFGKKPVKSVVVEGYSELIPDGKGGASVFINFAENRAFSDVKAGAVKGSKAGGGAPRDKSGKKTDPNQDLKDEVADLTAEFQRP